MNAVAERWHEHKAASWSPFHQQKVIDRWRTHIQPKVGHVPVRSITAEMLWDRVIKPIQEAGKRESANRVRHALLSMMTFAEDLGLIPNGLNPARELNGRGRRESRPLLSALDLDSARTLLRSVEAAQGKRTSKLALRFAAVTAAAPESVCTSQWSQFAWLDTRSAVWRMPLPSGGHFMHPLSRQACEVLQSARAIGGHTSLVFPVAQSSHQPLSESALVRLSGRGSIRALETVHIWRHVFRHVMSGKHPDRLALVSACLGAEKAEGITCGCSDPGLDERRSFMQEYADLLVDGFPPSRAVISGGMHGSGRP
ncbi:tyrosine-type recombinase/integrase [Falsiroseomonas sp. E2-1-a20]|uniref:tyrosine-type recombinase/integrase n=1 Tax=Falsiroseomonas sp. E2-1-a20 TaxID=3239300 RepID=UPI003F3A012B